MNDIALVQERYCLTHLQEYLHQILQFLATWILEDVVIQVHLHQLEILN
jgi:hypothetical protein